MLVRYSSAALRDFAETGVAVEQHDVVVELLGRRGERVEERVEDAAGRQRAPGLDAECDEAAAPVAQILGDAARPEAELGDVALDELAGRGGHP